MQYGYNMHQGMQPTPKREESFSSQATVFILKDKTWREQSQGLVQFVFDLNTYALRLIIAPGTNEEMDRRLRPRIRSKGPRAYVVRAQAPNNGEDSILAVRFEREEDSQNFRKFVEKRDADNNNTPSSHPSNQKYQNPQPPMQHTQQPQYQQPNYPQNMYQNMNPAMMQYNQPGPKYDNRYDNNYNNYYPSPSPQGAYPPDYRPGSTLAQPATTPHNGSQHHSIYSNTHGANPYGPNITNNVPLVHRPQASGSWNPSPNANVGPSYGGVEGAPDMYGHPNVNLNDASQQVPQGTNVTPGQTQGVVGQNGNNPTQQGPTNTQNPHYTPRSGNANAVITKNNENNQTSPANVNVLKLTEANLEQHNRVYAEVSMAAKRKNVRDIILEQLQWQRDHGVPTH